MHKRAAILSYLFCLILIGFCLEGADLFTILKNRLQSRSIPSAMLQYGPMGPILRKLDLVNVVPNDYSQYIYPKSSQFDISRRIFQRKSRIGIQLYSLGVAEVNPENMPGSLAIDRERLPGELPLLSISIDNNDLYGPTMGLLVRKNVLKRGRNWERPAYISYYENGKLLFATGVGLRIHGGGYAARGHENFRLYFREIYGVDQFKPGILFDKNSEPIKCMVVNNDVRRDVFGKTWYFMNPLAFDIAREIGCIVPQTKPVRVFLNGTPRGLCFFTEYLDENYLRSHYGHDNFLFYKERERRKRKKDIYRIVHDRLRKLKGQWTMEKAKKYFDIENLSRWFISILFCATTDAYQGLTVLDATNPSSKVFFINWDMNHSFRNKYEPELNNIWEQGTFESMVIQRWPDSKRGRLFWRLFKNDIQFRRYFARLFMDVLNHKLTPKFLESRINYYEKVAISYGIKDRDFIAQTRLFLKHRPAFIRKMMQKHIGSEESYLCTVKGPKGIVYEIDGFPARSSYHGWYFKATTVEIKIMSFHEKSFSHWLINGSEVSKDKDLIYRVNSETVIEPILKENALNKL